jgi:hypothetical protein
MKMQANFWALLGVSLLTATPALATKHVIGPYPNYKGTVPVYASYTIPITNSVTITDPVNGSSYTIQSHGGRECVIRVMTPVFVASYVEFESSPGLPFNPSTDTLKFTEIFAYDTQPSLPLPQVPTMTGFTPPPSSAQIQPLAPAYFVGLSGTNYYAGFNAGPSVGSLPGLSQLAGYDLSKFTGSSSLIVYVSQATVPANDFIAPQFAFSFDYQGYAYVGDTDPEYPFEHSWALNISQWNPQVAYVSDLEVEGPTVIPGYLEIIPPSNWGISEYVIGRYGYQANPGSEFTNVGTYTDWIVRGKTPYVEPGYAYLTKDGSQVSNTVTTQVVGQPFDLTFEYQGCTNVGGEYPYEHRWTLNISQWNPQAAYVSDLEVEGPHITPGYVEVIPPPNWVISPIVVGRYGYEANPGSEFTNVGTYTDWIVHGKTPYVEPGYAYLTQNGSPVSAKVPTMVVGETQEFEFSFDYLGYTNVGGEYPYEHHWALDITQWNPAVASVSDLEVEAPHIIPGYVTVIPPANWVVGEYTIGRYGYQANPGSEITAGGGYYGWTVKAKTPVVVPGYAYLTQGGTQVSAKVPTQVVGADFEFTYEYLGYQYIGGAYPYQHSWALNITQWNPQVAHVSDLDVEGPHVIPGYVEVVPPTNWHNSDTWYIGRYSYEANPGSEITAGGGIYGWKVNAKTPYVEPGYAYLTDGGQRVSARVPTTVVGRPPECGDLGYLAADLDHDCDVDLTDFVQLAGDWLGCTMPGGTNCHAASPTIVGLGMAFDGLSTGPAKILYLYDDQNIGTLEAGDEITAYRGMPITSGTGLAAAIDSQPVLTPGELVPVTVVRDGQTVSVVATAAAIAAEQEKKGPCDGKRCAKIQFSGGGSLQDQFYCDCVTPAPPESKCNLVQVITTDKAGKLVSIASMCWDSSGNKCEEIAKGH